MSAKLVVNPGTPQAWDIPLQPGVNRVGRGEDNDFQIPHGSVSTRHCEFIVSAAGVTLKDLGSTNGSFVNRARVTEAVLQPGQHIQLGAVDVSFEAAPSAPAPVRVTLNVPASGTAPAPKPAPVRLTVPTPAAPSASAAAPAPPLPPPVTAKPVTLRLGGAAPAPPPPPTVPVAAEGPLVTEAAEPPPLPVEPMAAGKQFCKSHSKTPARFYCPQCRKFFCDLCVGTRAAAGGAVHTCRACSSTVTPVQVHIERPEAGQKSFYASLPGAFGFPFRGMGILTLLLAALLFGGDEYAARMGFLSGPFGWIIRAAVFGFLFLYLQNIIHTTTADENESLGFPEAGGFFGAAFELGMTVLISFGLAIGLMLVAVFGEVEIPGAAYIAALILGCLYFPMAFLAVAMKDSVLAANPLIVIPTILKIPFEYLVTTLFLMAVFGLRGLGLVLSEVAGGMTLSTRSTSMMFTGLIVQAVMAILGVYLLTVCVRVLGILYNRKKHEFGWFSH